MTPDTLDMLAAAYADLALWASVHEGDPGDTGANEVAGVDRVELVWTPGAPGVLVSNSLTFELPPGTDLTHVGIWSAATGGTFRDSRANAVSFTEGGVYSVTINYTHAAAAAA